MFITDQPINSIEEDILGRGDFARSLTRAILRHKQRGSFVIGLYGGWGFGKTSIINMALEHINFVSENVDKIKPVVIKFKPWNFSGQNQIIFQFFRQLSAAFKQVDYSPELNEAGEYLHEIAEIFQPVSITSVLNSFITSGPSGTENDLSKTKSNLFSRDIIMLQEKINSILENQNNKVIIIIDDIDRLNSNEIREIFQIVKSLGNFINSVYVLSFHKNVVLKSLEESLKGCSGTDYLEDIIQVPFVVPTIPETKVYSLLYSEIKELIKDDEEGFNVEYWETLYNSGLRKFFRDIRAINRFLNVLKFDYELVKGEVNVVEFLAVTALQVFEPYVYDEIKNNKELFCYGRFVHRPMNAEVLDKLTQSTFSNILQRREKIAEEELKDLLSWLFPKIKVLSGISHSETFLKEFKINPTISDIANFEIYFKSAVIDTKISSMKINRIITKTTSMEEFREELLKLENYEIDDFLNRLINPDQFSILSKFMSGITKESIVSTIVGLTSCGDKLYNERFIEINKINNIIIDFINKIEDFDERYNILKQAVNSSRDNLHTSSLLIYNCIVNRAIFNQEHIYDLRETIKNKIESHEKLHKHENLALILINLKKLGYRNQVNAYVDKIKRSDEGFIHLISTFLSKGECIKGVIVRSDTIRILLPLAEVAARLKEISASVDFDKLDEHKRYLISKVSMVIKSTRLVKPEQELM